MNRGDRREPIFLEDKDRLLFWKTLGQVCQKTDWRAHAWCLTSNHFHLIIETPKANLVAGMKWFLGTYTSVTEELNRLRWKEDDLPMRRKGDPGKVEIARRLRQETTVALKWIAHRLMMGTWTNVTNRLYHFSK
jgi:hypothetical protein